MSNEYLVNIAHTISMIGIALSVSAIFGLLLANFFVSEEARRNIDIPSVLTKIVICIIMLVIIFFITK